MRIYLLRIQSVTFDNEVFDHLHGAKAGRKKRVIERDVGSRHHAWLADIISVGARGIDVGIDMQQGDGTALLQDSRRGVLEESTHQVQIFQSRLVRKSADFIEIGITKVPGRVQVDGLVGFRHAGKGIEGIDLHPGVKFRCQTGHKDRIAATVTAELKNIAACQRLEIAGDQEIEVQAIALGHYRAPARHPPSFLEKRLAENLVAQLAELQTPTALVAFLDIAARTPFRICPESLFNWIHKF